MEITPAQIRTLSATASARIVTGIFDHQQAIANGGIDTPLRLCHFLAQLAHESAHFQVTREFASGAQYEGRQALGNTEPGDGKRFRGRGLIQTTGRANYRDTTTDIRAMIADAPNFVDEPEALEEFPWALLSAVSFWRRKRINGAADRDDVVAVTKIINGGTNGLPDRQRYLARAKAIWLTQAPEGPAAAAEPTLRAGDEGDAVVRLQNALIEAGFRVWPDGKFGELTKRAVIAFQTHSGLPGDGVVGPITWGALLSRDAG
jgi:putative chitinase